MKSQVKKKPSGSYPWNMSLSLSGEISSSTEDLAESSVDFLTLELLQMDVRLDAHASDRTKLKMTPLEVLHERLEVVAPSFVLVQAVGIGDCVYFAGYNKPDDEEAARMIQLEQALPTLVLFCWRPLSSAPELDLNEVLIEEPPQIAIGGTFVGAETHVVQVFGKVPDGHGEFKPHGGWAVNVESGATVFTSLDEFPSPAARVDASGVWSPRLQSVLLFGGWPLNKEEGGGLADLWELKLEQDSWGWRSRQGFRGPSRRGRAALAVSDKGLFVFGGQTRDIDESSEQTREFQEIRESHSPEGSGATSEARGSVDDESSVVSRFADSDFSSCSSYIAHKGRVPEIPVVKPSPPESETDSESLRDKLVTDLRRRRKSDLVGAAEAQQFDAESRNLFFNDLWFYSFKETTWRCMSAHDVDNLRPLPRAAAVIFAVDERTENAGSRSWFNPRRIVRAATGDWSEKRACETYSVLVFSGDAGGVYPLTDSWEFRLRSETWWPHLTTFAVKPGRLSDATPFFAERRSAVRVPDGSGTFFCFTSRVHSFIEVAGMTTNDWLQLCARLSQRVKSLEKESQALHTRINRYELEQITRPVVRKHVCAITERVANILDAPPQSRHVGQCVICFVDAVQVAYDPCGHAVCCYHCTEKLQRTKLCPVCRTKILSVHRLRFSNVQSKEEVGKLPNLMREMESMYES